MKTVFIDLEFCPIKKECRKERKICRCEIIEVGAVKLDESNEIVGRFDAFVKPMYGEISPSLTALTHIIPKDLAGADGFKEVMDSFVRWVGDEETVVYSWSNTDLKQIQSESRLKGYMNDRLEELYDGWKDFQMLFGKILGIDYCISLEKAIYGAGITFEGNQHSAIADAENTAMLYVLTCDKDAFEASAKRLLEYMKPTPMLSINLGSLFTVEMMEQLNISVDCA